MTAQTEAQKLSDAWYNAISYHIEAGDAMAEKLLHLEAANAELLQALKMNAQVVSWLSFGECRGFTEGLPTALEATDAARAAIKKHGGT